MFRWDTMQGEIIKIGLNKWDVKMPVSLDEIIFRYIKYEMLM